MTGGKQVRPQTLPRTADVVIVGGGCMGASVAFHLARAGITNVVLLERESMLGTGSTGRNAGGVRHQFSQECNIRLSIESIRVFERFQEEVGYPADLHQDGYLFLLSSPESEATFRTHVSLQRRLGVDVDWLDAAGAARLAPGLGVEGVVAATFCRRDGIADPNGVTMGFAKAAERAGVTIVRETDVTGIDVAAGRVTGVRTSRGPVATPVVVNAAGPHARSIGRMAGVDVPVDPYRRHIFIATAPPAGVPLDRIMVIDFDTTFYFHREGAGVLFGMGDVNETPTFDTTVQWDFLPRVIDVAMRRLPALGDAAISHSWAGLYEVTPDRSGIAGAVPGFANFFEAHAFTGRGVMQSYAVGTAMAERIDTGRFGAIDLAPLDRTRFTDPERWVTEALHL